MHQNIDFERYSIEIRKYMNKIKLEKLETVQNGLLTYTGHFFFPQIRVIQVKKQIVFKLIQTKSDMNRM